MKNEVTRRTQAERRAKSQMRLLEAAAEILVEEGFAAATFDRISRRAGYSRGMVTERFGSKDEFVANVIQWVADQMDAHYPSEIEKDGSALGGVRAKINTTFWGLKGGAAQAYFVLLSAALANRLPQTAHFLEHHRLEKQEYVRLVKLAQENGQIDPALDARDLSSLLGCLMMGIAIQSQIDPELNVESLQKTLNAAMKHLTGPNIDRMREDARQDQD